jgi:outer membrane protein TolC
MARHHWTRFLPEVGLRIYERGDKIEAARQRLKALKAEIIQAERELRKEVSRNWTAEEIRTAKYAALGVNVTKETR